MGQSLADDITLTAQMDPERPAIVCNGYTTTYEALDRGIRATETWLMDEGQRSWKVVDEPVRKLGSPSNSDVVMVSAIHPVEFLTCLIASLDSGVAVLPVPPRVSKQTRIEMIRKLHIGRVLRRSKQTFSGKPLVRSAFQSGTLIDITSGSYGAKKLVDRSIGNLNDESSSVAQAIGLTMGRKILITTPLAHSFGGGIARAALMSGATIYTPGAFELTAKLTQIRAMIGDVDVVTGVPYIFRTLLRDWDGRELPNLKCYAGGEVVPPSLIRRWVQVVKTDLMQEYGLSEGGIVSFGDAHGPAESIGTPIRGVRIDIADDEELIVYRQWSPTRYHFGEAKRTFVPGGGVRTGDLGYLRHGHYFLRGRSKSIIIVAGMKVVPAEVENVLLGHYAVEEAVVFGVKDDVRGEHPVAVVTMKNGIDKAEVLRFTREHLESYKVPRRIYVTSEFPRTESGKIDRAAIIVEGVRT